MLHRVVIPILLALPWLLPGCTLVTPLDGLSGGDSPATKAPASVADGTDAAFPADRDGAGNDADPTPPDVAAPNAKSDVDAGVKDAALGPTDGSPVDGSENEASAVDARPVATLMSGRTSPGGIGLDATFVYWVERPSHGLWRVRKTGGVAERVDVPDDAVNDPYDVAVSGATLYWTERDGAVIAYRALSGGARHELPSTGAALLGFIALDGNTAYTTDYVTSIMTSVNVFSDSTEAGGIFSNQPNMVSGIDVRVGTVVFAQATYHAILSRPTGQNVASYIGYTKGDIAGLAFDGDDIYFLENERAITRMSAKDGSTSSFVDLGSSVGSGDVAVDGTHVYWSEPTTGKIRSKPL